MTNYERADRYLWSDIDPTGDLGAHPLVTGDIAGLAPNQQAGVPGLNTRAYERVQLVRPVDVTIRRLGETRTGSGLVADASLNSLYIETDDPLDHKMPVHVDLSIPGGFSMTFRGRVARVDESGMAILFYADDLTWQFRARFLEMALEPVGERMSATVRQATGVEKSDRNNERDTLAIAKKWMDVAIDPDDDKRHQAFIHECLKRRRLDYATERYREMKVAGREDAEAYLQQVGKVLAFSAMPDKPKTGAEGSKLKRNLILLGAVIVVLLTALLCARMMLERGAPAPAPIQEVESISLPGYPGV